MKRLAANLASTTIAAGMVAVIAGLSLTGRWPGHAGLEHFAPNGLVAAPVQDVTRVEVAGSDGHVAFERAGSGWRPEGRRDDAETRELAKHVEAGLRFLNVSTPLRFLGPDQYASADLASFGLDQPPLTVTLAGPQGELGRVSFGSLNPAGTSQYAAVAGRPGVYLLSRYVGGEWQLAADRAARLAQGSRLLPVPIAQIWAVEVVADGQLTRFERDSAGLWLHHIGQHVHASAADAHVADPARAPLIARELAALDQGPARKAPPGDLDQQLREHGLARPRLILLLYARDNPSPVARLEFGAAPEGDGRQYARDRASSGLVTVDKDEPEHVRRLLQLAVEPPR